MSQAESVDKRWYSRRYEEDASWFTARPVDVSPSWNDVRFRHWFRVEKAAVESFDLFVLGASTVTLFLNGDWISRREMDEDVVRYRLSGDMFEDGDNLLAIAFASFYKEHAPAFSILFQPVAQRSNRLTYRDLELSSSPLSQPGYPPQALFDSNPYSDCAAKMSTVTPSSLASFSIPAFIFAQKSLESGLRMIAYSAVPEEEPEPSVVFLSSVLLPQPAKTIPITTVNAKTILKIFLFIINSSLFFTYFFSSRNYCLS